MARPAWSSSVIPAALAKAARRFETWRTSRTQRQIPDDLWRLAAEAGSRYGVSCAARALGLSYYDLGKRVEALTTAERVEARPAFVEILQTRPSVGSECVVEFENAAGGKMRIQLKSGNVPDLAVLWRLFLEQHP